MEAPEGEIAIDTNEIAVASLYDEFLDVVLKSGRIISLRGKAAKSVYATFVSTRKSIKADGPLEDLEYYFSE